MVFIARLAKEVLQPGELQDNAHERQLSELQTIPAWILLGEPGSGKSQAFKSEADACQGVCLTIADFLSDELDDLWIGKTLFLDGLDEIRASTGDTTILGKVRSRLRKLGQPNFRIACRAADWYGQSDKADLLSVSPNGLLPTFQLSPLGEQDILTILESNFGITDSKQFVAQANAHGIHALLYNPQTLKLLAQAIKGNDWPDTRNQTFELACLSQVQEENKRHRDRTRDNKIAPHLLLDAAGQLFCVVLLSDKSGISLDAGCANDRFPSLEDLAPPDPIAAAAAVHTSLFVPSTSNEERLEPSHRSIAEYLAAQWLAKQIDINGLALSRALNLMLGIDGKTVASLRGLYGWLALHSKSARTQLIHLDPLTVVQYGDVQTMPIDDKRLLLSMLYRDTQSRPAHLWSARDAGTLGALFDEALAPEFLQALESSKRDEATQTYVVFLLTVLKQARPEQQVLKTLRSVAADDSRWSRTRTQALKIWLEQNASPSIALAFLNATNAGVINDPDDELTGLLLEHLYPSTIAAQDLLKHLHICRCRASQGCCFSHSSIITVISNFSFFMTKRVGKASAEVLA